MLNTLVYNPHFYKALRGLFTTLAFNMTHCEPFCAENWFQGCFEQHLLSSMRAQFDDKAGKKFIHDMNEVFT